MGTTLIPICEEKSLVCGGEHLKGIYTIARKATVSKVKSNLPVLSERVYSESKELASTEQILFL